MNKIDTPAKMRLPGQHRRLLLAALFGGATALLIAAAIVVNLQLLDTTTRSQDVGNLSPVLIEPITSTQTTQPAAAPKPAKARAIKPARHTTTAVIRNSDTGYGGGGNSSGSDYSGSNEHDSEIEPDHDEDD